MEIASQVARTKSEAESQARKVYRDSMTRQRPDGEEAPDDELAAVITAMSVLGISPEQAEEDARLYVDVVSTQADRDRAAAEAERLGPRGDLSFGQELDNLDAGLARDINAMLEPKRALLARMARFDAAAETLSSKESSLATKRNAVPRLCG